MSRILVTGGAGFIGSHITERLVAEGATITVLDNLSTGNSKNLDQVEKKITFVLGDVRDLELVKSLARNSDYIIHHAALVSVPQSIKDPITAHEVNITGTMNILLAAKQACVKRVVYAATSAVYGNSKVLPKQESLYPEPLSPYAVSKYAGELYLQLFAKLYDVETVGFRYFNVYGPKQNPNSQYAAVVPKFITQLLNNQQPVIYGDGQQTRDFIYVGDVVEANILALKKPDVSGKIFNIASGHSISIKELYQHICKLLGTNIEPIYEKTRDGEVRDSLADISFAEKVLSFNPRFELETGLAITANWYQDSAWAKSCGVQCPA